MTATPEQTLQSLAQLDPDYPIFTAALPSEFTGADSALPAGLAEDVIALLRTEQPELSGWLDEQPSASLDKLAVDPLLTAGALAAILFLLRSHIKITGKQIFFEHKPMDSDLLGKVIEKLASFMGY